MTATMTIERGYAPAVELRDRVGRTATAMRRKGLDAIIVSTNANLLYVAGTIINGYAYIARDGEVTFFVRRPAPLLIGDVALIRKPEEIPQWLQSHGKPQPSTFGLEYDIESYATVVRLANIFPQSSHVSASDILAAERAVKSRWEIEQLRASAAIQACAYSKIPKLYRPGMTDVELQIEVERELRRAGTIGLFRMRGGQLEMYMGSLLTGDNADEPSAYDFAMGGAGQSAALPVGADGSAIKPGQAVMIDLGGNAGGWMTDMTRTYSVGALPQQAIDAHNLSIEIAHAIARRGHVGAAAAELYDMAIAMVEKAGFAPYFMGHRQQASFVGHGIGLEVNELPVLHHRSKEILQVGNVIAVEPKFVIPGVGAVGIENTYVVTDRGMDNLTVFPEDLIQLD